MLAAFNRFHLFHLFGLSFLLLCSVASAVESKEIDFPSSSTPQIEVTNDEIQSFYDHVVGIIKSNTDSRQYTVKYIVTDSFEKGQMAISKFKSGVSFEHIALEFSIFKKNGGISTRTIEPRSFPKDYATFLKSLKVGDINEQPVQLPGNLWQVLIVLSIDDPLYPPIDEVREQIMKEITKRKQKSMINNHKNS